MSVDTIRNKQRPAEILLIEDNPHDALLARKAFDGAPVSCNMTTVDNGPTALAMLRGDTPAPMPDLILLDLSLPDMNGIEVLRAIKSAKKLWHIPVIVLSASQNEKDITACHNLLANGYVIKPGDFGQYQDFARAVTQFWFAHAVTRH